MKRYTELKIKPYKQIFKEAFLVSDIGRAIELTAKVIGNRIGTTINMSKIATSFERDDGSFTGVPGIMDDGRGIRFNWRIGGSSGNIVSIDVWNEAKATPDITIDVDGLNIVQTIDTIVEAIQNGEPDVYFYTESNKKENSHLMKLHEKESVRPSTKKSVNAWIKKLVWDEQNDAVDEEKLKNNKFSKLFNDYKFWYEEWGRDEGYESVSDPTFRKFLGIRLAQLGIDNIFTKKVNVKKAGKEQILVDKGQEKKFEAEIYEMSLEDIIMQMKASVSIVSKGIRTATLISGTAGIGKTHHVLEALSELGYKEVTGSKWSAKNSGRSYKIITGDIKNPRALYQTLYDWNDPDLILVFDDVNSILKNKSNVELLRSATSNKRVRDIFYSDNKITADSRRYKPFLEFESKIIILTNIPIKKIDNAIVSRTAPVDAQVDFEEISDAIMKTLPEIDPVGYEEEKKDVFDFIVHQVGEKFVQNWDFRIFQACLVWRLSGSPYWKKFAYNTIKKQ